MCPDFSYAVVMDTVDRLPDHIDLSRNMNWAIRCDYVEEENRLLKKPTGIVHKSTLGKDLNGIIKVDVMKESGKKRFIPAVTFDEIGGIKPIIRKIREVIELPLRNPDLFAHLGIKPHRGILLFGPPGCGKTMIAKAIANEVEAHFINIKGPELINKYYGQSEENLRNLFDEASDYQPSVIFFDEIDSVAQLRSSAENLRMESKFVNQLLTLIDGVEDYGNICVIAATNRPELIDEALLRRGRFDYQLEVPKPDKEGCMEILKLHTRTMPLDDIHDPFSFADELMGMTGADIAYIVRETAFNCMRRNIDLNTHSISKPIMETEDKHYRITTSDFITALREIKRTGEKSD